MRSYTYIINEPAIEVKYTNTHIPNRPAWINDDVIKKNIKVPSIPSSIHYPYQSLLTRYALLSLLVPVVDEIEREIILKIVQLLLLQSHWLRKWFRFGPFSYQKKKKLWCVQCIWSVGRLCIHRCIYLQICLTHEKVSKEIHRVKYRALMWSEGEQILLTFFLAVSALQCIHIHNIHLLYWRLHSIFRYASVNMSGIMAKAARRRRLMNFCLIITITTSTDNGSRQISSCGWHFSRLLMNSFWYMTFVTSQHCLAFRVTIQSIDYILKVLSNSFKEQPIQMTS